MKFSTPVRMAGRKSRNGRKTRKNGRKSNSRRSRKQQGGGEGAGWGFNPDASIGGTVNNPVSAAPITACRAALPTGYMSAGYSGPKGLPGMSGGRKQSGGRYGMGPPDGTVSGFPGGAGIAGTMALPCEASRSAIPPSGAGGNLNRVGGDLWDGGKSPLLSGGAYPAVATAANSEVYTAPTAGYTQLNGSPAGVITTAAGTNLMVNFPADGRAMSPACLKTGGRRSGRGRGRGRGRKGKSGRKSVRK